MRIPQFVARLFIALGRLVGHLRRGVLRLIKGRPPASVIAYRGHGNRERVLLAARVVDDPGLGEPTADDSAWANALRMFRVFDARRVSGARLRVEYAGVEACAAVDRRGFAAVELALPAEGLPTGVRPARWTLVAPEPSEGDAPTADTEVYVPRPDARFALISDVDDTVIESRATNAIRLAFETLRSNVYRRVALPGMAPFYRALAGVSEPHTPPGEPVCHSAVGQNPVVWLTSSIWRVYGLLRAFFEIHGFPAGPLFMSDARLLRDQWVADRHRLHKLAHLRRVRDLWPGLPLVLSGDCGQRDPEIFAELALESPERVAAIYLRDLGNPARRAAVEALFAPVDRAGVPVCVAADALTFARHAVAQGLMPADRVGPVRRAIEAAHRATPGLLSEAERARVGLPD